MPGNEFDVLVIGEGLSGITATAAACQQGARVMLASKGPGTFVLGTGCVDLDGFDSGAAGLGRRDAHEMQEAISFFLKLTAAAGCAYEGGVRERRLLPTILGTFAETSLAPRQLWKGDPRGASKAIVVGIENLFTFDANFVAERLSFHSTQIALARSYRAANIQLPRVHEQHWLTPLDIASEIDRNPAYRQALIAALKSVVGDADLLIIPGILGIDAGDDDLLHLEAEVGCAICELPTLPPSVPGLRLLRRLESHLVTMGAETCTGFAVQELCMDGRRCVGAVLDTPGKPRIIHSDSVILASGKFSRLLEDHTPRKHASDLQVNQELQPIDASGPLWTNVFACGDVLGKFESRYGGAIAIVSGYQAGMLACQRGVQYATS